MRLIDFAKAALKALKCVIDGFGTIMFLSFMWERLLKLTSL